MRRKITDGSAGRAAHGMVAAPGGPATYTGEQAMKWTDSREIAIALADKHPDIDPQRINFVDLHQWVIELDGFDDDPSHSGEKILEAIQAHWIDESDFDDED